MKIFNLLLILVLGEGMPVTRINKSAHDDKKEPWSFGDDDDDSHEDKVPSIAKHLSSKDIKEQLSDISKKVENVLDKYPGLELETFYSEKDNKIVLTAKVNLQDHVGSKNSFDNDDDDFTHYAEVANDSLDGDGDDDYADVDADGSSGVDHNDDADDSSGVDISFLTAGDDDKDDHYFE